MLGRRTMVLIAVVLMGAGTLFAAFYAIVTPDMYRSTDPARPFGYVLVPDDDERLGQSHLVTVSIWSHRDATIQAATLHYRLANQTRFTSAPMTHVGRGSTWAAELPELDAAGRWFYYVSARDDRGGTINIPEHAPDKPLPSTRWEARVNLVVLSIHIVLMLGAILFLFHTVYYHLLILFAGTDVANPYPLGRKAQRAMLWGWLTFFVGGIPLGIYVSGKAFGWANAWGAWPLGTDITDTKTQFLLLYWLIPLLLRKRIGERRTAWLSMLGAVLTTIVYAIPHSYFVQ